MGLFLSGYGFTFQDKKLILVSQRRTFENKAAWEGVNMRKYISSQVSLIWYNIFHIYMIIQSQRSYNFLEVKISKH